ncbi:hypothetical protein Q7P37_009206 [Cladosporium fusiforme]
MSTSILIIGAGTLGTSMAHHLSLASPSPNEITIIDRDPSPPSHAAAIDLNRIIRTDYASKLYSDLANEALHAWTWDLELQRFFHKTGWLVLGAEGSEAVRRVFRERGFDRSWDVEVGSVGERWEGLKGSDVGGFGSAYFNEEVGWVEAAKATGVFMRAAEKRGVKRVVGQVRELVWSKEEGCVEGVRLDDGRVLTAEKVVLAAGAWTSSLLSPVEDALSIPDGNRIERQVQARAVVSAYFKLSEEESRQLAHPKNMPIVVFGKQGEVIPPSNEQRLLKYNLSGLMIANTITTDSGQTISIPTTPERSQYDLPDMIKKEMEKTLTSKLLPEYVRDKKPDYYRICWDACTPTEDLLMCRHPYQKLGNLYVAVGGSFSGYKFLPNAGKYMLNILDDKSNGPEKDRAFGWKKPADLKSVRNLSAVVREWRYFQDGRQSSSVSAKL